ncbi:CopG family transcriptional regulator [Nonlabens sp.]|uniref:CopG family transcriptional regulator n=1 Tax=Nonlabens sp. TaxID=1888209 RepID=UPI003F69A98B
MATFTSTLPDDLLKQLSDAAKLLKLPKNKLIEKALRVYLEQLDKAAYVRSYKQMSNDDDMLNMAAEGMTEYLTTLNQLDDETV